MIPWSLEFAEEMTMRVAPAGAGFTVSDTLTLPGQPFDAVAVTVNVKVTGLVEPVLVGAPEKTPVLRFMLKPGGTLPLVDHVKVPTAAVVKSCE
jgi:hypothetical protein